MPLLICIVQTNIGDALISTNPYKKLQLYTSEAIDVYRSHRLYELPPHVYAVADRAWRALRTEGVDQAVVITGDSGSGKTEASKLCLQYLSAVTSHARHYHEIKFHVLQSNPVLEAFGNARTSFNENSSRFVSILLKLLLRRSIFGRDSKSATAK